MIRIGRVLKDFAASEISPKIRERPSEIELKDIYVLLLFRQAELQRSTVLLRQNQGANHPI